MHMIVHPSSTTVPSATNHWVRTLLADQAGMQDHRTPHSVNIRKSLAVSHRGRRREGLLIFSAGTRDGHLCRCKPEATHRACVPTRCVLAGADVGLTACCGSRAKCGPSVYGCALARAAALAAWSPANGRRQCRCWRRFSRP